MNWITKLFSKKRTRSKKGENLRTVLAIFAEAQEPLSIPDIVFASRKRGSPIPPSSVRSVLRESSYFEVLQDGKKWQLTETAANIIAVTQMTVHPPTVIGE